MHFRVYEFEVGVNESLFSGNEQQKVYVCDRWCLTRYLKIRNGFLFLLLVPTLFHTVESRVLRERCFK